MNGWKLGARARGHGRKRAVSPIIATILLVAITVVLAAVLYVLISGLTSGGGSIPYSVGMSETGATTTGGNWIAITVNPTNGLNTGQFGLKITNTTSQTDAPVANPDAATCKAGATYSQANCITTTGGWYAVLELANGSVGSVYSGAGTATWSATSPVSGGMTIFIISHGTISGDIGYTLTAFSTGTSSVSGQVTL